jgi:type III restriction enzyme
MSEVPLAPDHGITPASLADIRALCERTPGVVCLWLFGSRAAGTHRARSDIDLAVDAPDWTAADAQRFADALKQLPMVYSVDCVWWQGALGEVFRREIAAQRKVLWQPAALERPAQAPGAGVDLKPFQERVLACLGDYLDELARQSHKAQTLRQALRVMEGVDDELRAAEDYPQKAWAALRKRGALPPAFADQPHSSRFDGADRAIPNLCLKVPTGGGKTLLAAASVARVFSTWFKRHTGLALWVVPNEAIYRQTLKTLSDRDHPYRQILNVAGAGRVKILEKNSPLSRMDVDSHLCVMVLMLASAARQSKETLRFFRDRGNVLGFLPREDDIEGHWSLLQAVPNLDVYAPWGDAQENARRQKGSIVKSSLGNVMRLLRPMVVIDEGHHGYTENALKTLDGFNPGFLLELSATPRIASDKGSGSNILVDVRGTDLDEAQMVKLPIHVDVQHWSDWQACLMASVQRLNGLQADAQMLQAETARYIRPILLVQVERTGADTRDAGFIHAQDVHAYLMQLGFSERQIAIKTSEKNDLKEPENIDLLSPTCEVRVIVTKQALQEGWDCPFAYVLCALAAGRNPAAMTQLVGRILRQPQVTKTDRESLDACYVLCHDARTSEVVKAIKRSLEGEGMGDLALAVTGHGDDAPDVQRIHQTRRPALAGVRLFLPKVTWVSAGGARRELVYESDVLARVDWAALDVLSLARDWSPNREAPLGEQFDVSLDILVRGALPQRPTTSVEGGALDKAQVVRSLLDLAPNAWWVWEWVGAVVTRLRLAGFSETVLAASSASLIERLRVDVERERDRLAEAVFEDSVASGWIEFALRADASDYELPTTQELQLAGAPKLVMRSDARPVEKGLLEPALQTPDLNGFEAEFAGYLDGKNAVQWWHRNVAKTHYGLQGWKRQKVYPDFVFGLVESDGMRRTVLLETKGAHLAGSADTGYKRALLQRLDAAYRDERWNAVGQLELRDGERHLVSCDLLLDVAWQGALERRWFDRTGSGQG